MLPGLYRRHGTFYRGLNDAHARQNRTKHRLLSRLPRTPRDRGTGTAQGDGAGTAKEREGVGPMAKLNRPTPEGIKTGSVIAGLVEAQVTAGSVDTRCTSCAFRRGSYPNGCLPTVSTATECVVYEQTFYCHQTDRKGKPCEGWRVATDAVRDNPAKMVHAMFPGVFTDEDLTSRQPSE